MNMKNNKGFSLVELIVVIAIMAILAAVAVVGVSVYIPKAQKQADETLVGDIIHAGETYFYIAKVPAEIGTAGGVLGYVVVTDERTVAGGAFGLEAMEATFGENFTTSTLQWNGWTSAGSTFGSVSESIANSSYLNVGTDNLLNDVQDCAGSLADFLRGGYEGTAGAETLDGFIGGTYVSDYLKGYKDDEITADVLSNAVVFAISQQLSEDSDDVKENFENGNYLLRNWDNPANPNGYDASGRLNNIGNDDSNLLSEVANTYAALEAFSAYMGIPLELEFDSNSASMKIVADVANECERVLNEAYNSDPTKMIGYLGGQSAKDADAYISIMTSVNDLKDDYHSDLNSTDLFNNQAMLDRVNGYVAVSNMSSEMRNEINSAINGAESAVIVIYTVTKDGTFGCTVYEPSADPRY